MSLKNGCNGIQKSFVAIDQGRILVRSKTNWSYPSVIAESLPSTPGFQPDIFHLLLHTELSHLTDKVPTKRPERKHRITGKQRGKKPHIGVGSILYLAKNNFADTALFFRYTVVRYHVALMLPSSRSSSKNSSSETETYFSPTLKWVNITVFSIKFPLIDT